MKEPIQLKRRSSVYQGDVEFKKSRLVLLHHPFARLASYFKISLEDLLPDLGRSKFQSRILKPKSNMPPSQAGPPVFVFGLPLEQCIPLLVTFACRPQLGWWLFHVNPDQSSFPTTQYRL